MIDTPCESNITTVVEEDTSYFYQKIPRNFCIAVSLQWLNTINLFSNRRTN